MNKQGLISSIASKSGLTKVDSEKALIAFEETVMETVVSGEKVMLVGFGSFEPVERESREGRNPKTGEPVAIPAKTVPKFKPGKEFKDRVANKE